MRLLLANDDGIYSPGLAALAAVASDFGELHIVAPDVEQSSMGQAITHSRPISIRRTPIDGYDAHRVNGTPADCVALGVDLFKGVDVVLSGINLGPNIGSSMWHSGTLAAAKQAALLGLRGIALSTPTGEADPDFERLRPWVAKILEHLLFESDVRLANVNFPPIPSAFGGRDNRYRNTMDASSRSPIRWGDHSIGSPCDAWRSWKKAPTGGRCGTDSSPSLRCVSISPTTRRSRARVASLRRPRSRRDRK